MSRMQSFVARKISLIRSTRRLNGVLGNALQHKKWLSDQLAGYVGRWSGSLLDKEQMTDSLGQEGPFHFDTVTIKEYQPPKKGLEAKPERAELEQNPMTEIIQRVFLEIIDEIRDEFPNLLRLTSSNQQGEVAVKESGSVVAKVFSSLHAAVLMNGLNKLSRSSKSVAKLLQPRLARNFAELNMISRRLLKNVNAPKQPLYKTKDRKLLLYDVISYPAKTALTGVMCASYAALIYLAVAISKFLEKLKKIVQRETSRESSSNGVNGNGLSRAAEAASYSAPSATQEVPSEGIIKTSRNSRSIYTLLSALDSENEQ